MGGKPKPLGISQRKSEHIRVASSGDADFQRSTLLEQVRLVHQSLPELATADINLTTRLAGHTLAAPIVISGMTGGTPQAERINRDLARAAEQFGVAFGLGSQRAMAQHPELRRTFAVREAAPNVVLFGNLGVVQAKQLGAAAVQKLVDDIDANALAIHLNPAQELIQSDGDRDFRGGLDVIEELTTTLSVPVIVKETGCGLSPQAAQAICDRGVRTVDTSGAGGTSWVAVEALRAKDQRFARLGEVLWNWGIPTAVSVAACVNSELETIATGGLRTGADIAKAIALGARCGGLAAPVLRAHQRGGYDGVCEYLNELITTLRSISLLCGCQDIADLQTAPRHIGSDLRGWLDDLGLR